MGMKMKKETIFFQRKHRSRVPSSSLQPSAASFSSPFLIAHLNNIVFWRSIQSEIEFDPFFENLMRHKTM